GGRGCPPGMGDEDAVLHEQTQAVPAMDCPASHGGCRLDKGHFPSGAVHNAAQFVHPIMEEFDSFLGRSILAVDEREEPVLLESVGVLGGPLDRHPETFPNGAKSGVAARRDFVEKEEAGTHPEVSQQLHGGEWKEGRKSARQYSYILKFI